MSDERTEYLASGSGVEPPGRDRLDLIREILAEEATWSDPPPEVADQLLAAIGSDKTTDDVQGTGGSRRWPWVAAAALATVVVALAAGLTGIFSTPDQQLIAMEGTDLQPAATGQASIRETDAGWWIRLDLDDLPAAGVGSYYEGWVWSDEGDGVSIGTFHMRGDEAVILWSGVDPDDYPSIWVTLEDEDGDPAASEQIVMKGRP